MTLKEKLYNNYTTCAGDFIYLFIGDDMASKFSARIQQKRRNQILVAKNDALNAGVTLAELKTIIGNKIQQDYGMTPATIILRLAMGYQVYSRDGVKIGRVGATATLPIDVNTGLPVGYSWKKSDAKNEDANYNVKLTQQSKSTDGNFQLIYTEKNEPGWVGYIGEKEIEVNGVTLKPGQIISTYNPYTKKYEEGEQTAQGQKATFWLNSIASWAPLIKDIISQIADLITNFPNKAEEIANKQDDGWIPTEPISNPNSGTNDNLPKSSNNKTDFTTYAMFGLLGVGAYMIYKNSDNNDNKQKL